MKILIQENKDNINTKFHYIGRMVSAAENVHAQPWMEKDLYKVYDVLDTYQPDMLIIGYENLIGQTFLITFGNSYYNNGNTNAGVGPIRFYGKAITD